METAQWALVVSCLSTCIALTAVWYTRKSSRTQAAALAHNKGMADTADLRFEANWSRFDGWDAAASDEDGNPFPVSSILVTVKNVGDGDALDLQTTLFDCDKRLGSLPSGTLAKDSQAAFRAGFPSAEAVDTAEVEFTWIQPPERVKRQKKRLLLADFREPPAQP